jgi:hypothetical protein
MQKTRQAALMILTILILSIGSCTEDPLTIGKQFIHSSTYTELIDTVSIRVSTFKADSMQTSAQNVALVGKYHTYGLGSVVSQSYLAYTNSNLTTIDNKEQFDSLMIALTYSGYSLGDTLKPFKLRIHLLTDTIGSYSKTIYNTMNFSHTAPVDSFTFYPQPHRSKELLLRLNDTMGKELWQLIKSNIATKSFYEKFKGLMLSCDTSVSQSIIGWTVQDTSGVILELYSHKRSDFEKTIIRKLHLKGSSYQSNQIESHAESEGLKKLTSLKKTASESTTNQMGFIQSGTGYFTRIDVPYLNKMQEFNDRGRIVKAILKIKPVTTYIGINNLPTEINISQIDKINYIGSNLTDDSGNPLTGNMVKDLGLNQDSYYSYDITNYINNQLSQEIIPEGEGLVLSFPSAGINKTVDALQIGGFTNKHFQSKLLIYYYDYDRN